MRIAIIGNSGSGKTTLARQLAREHELDMLDLDTVAWESGKIAVPREPQQALAQVRAFCTATPRWVVEGCYAGLTQAALAEAELLLFLEPGAAACRANCHSRPWEPHKFRSPQEQDRHFDRLLDWVDGYYARGGDASLREHQALFDAFGGRKKKLAQRVHAADIAGMCLQPI